MKLAIVITILLCGTFLAASPMILETNGVHSDRVFHAQWAGFIFLGFGIGLAFKAVSQNQG